MFGRYSVAEIVSGQIKTVCDDRNPWSNKLAAVCFFGLPAFSPIVQELAGLHLTENIVSIVVSAASVFAGLLLNLLVVIYGFAPRGVEKSASNDRKTESNLDQLVEYCFYNISYAILICGLLVIFSLVFLAGLRYVKLVPEVLVYYFGFQLFLSIAQILKRCHSLLNHRLTRAGQRRAAEAEAAWGPQVRSNQ